MNGSVYNNKAVIEQLDNSLAYTERTSNAQYTHEVGTYFMYNDQFMRTTVKINVGDIININTNCVVDNVGAALTALAVGKQDATNYTVSQINSYLSMVAANPLSEGFASKNIAIEDSNHPGCYYQVNSGVQQWINPYNNGGNDYTTIYREYGKPVHRSIHGLPYMIYFNGSEAQTHYMSTSVFDISNVDRVWLERAYLKDVDTTAHVQMSLPYYTGERIGHSDQKTINIEASIGQNGSDNLIAIVVAYGSYCDTFFKNRSVQPYLTIGYTLKTE